MRRIDWNVQKGVMVKREKRMGIKIRRTKKEK